MGNPITAKPATQLWPYSSVSVGSKTGSCITVIDLDGIRNGISTVSKQLFKQDGTVEVLACRWSETEKLKPNPIFAIDDLTAYIDIWLTDKPTPNPATRTHLFLIDQANTKSCLDISEAGMNTLLNGVTAFPQLGHVLPAFAAEDAPCHEGRSDFYAEMSRDPGSGKLELEMCMMLKYVELNGNTSDRIPWSVRQQLFYQHFDHILNRESVIILRPSSTLRKRIQDVFHGSTGHVFHWSNLVVVVISTLAAGWAEYAKFLDLGVWNIDKSANFTDPFAQSLGEANFKTLQATKLYHDLLLRATHVLQNNICVLEGLAHKIEKRGITENGGHAEKYELLQTTTRDVKNKLCAVLRHMSLIQARLNRITEAIRDCISLRASHHSATDSSNMKSLTFQSIREARTVKAIALVTLVYLPATFVATFMGMDYIDVSGGSRGLLDVSAKPSLWVYLALMVPLTVGTLVCWWMWEWWSRRGSREGGWEGDGKGGFMV